ncbi:MAG TPA: M13 family metallopeptidase [Rhodanobacteraceae bacterium]|jgi:putative endopeptidase|nr:M13 family metallopeptidase [Rhodanobacteraceae bacterium]
MSRPSQLLLVVAIAAACAACSQQSPQSSAPASAASAANAATAATPAPASTAPDIGINLGYIDHAVKPGDNFFQYANGDWLKTATIPADRSNLGTFQTVHERTEQRVTDIIQNAAASHPAPGSNARMIADFYAAFMDTQAIEQHGLAPLQSRLDAIHAIHSREDLARVLGSRLRQDVDPVNYTDFHTNHLFGLFVAQGLTDPSHNIAYLLQGGLTMPDRDYYLSDSKTMAGYRDAFKTYIAAVLTQAGVKDAKAAAGRVFDLETQIAKAQATIIDSQDPHKANNLWPLADFGRRAPGLDWNAYFKAAGLAGQKDIDAWQPDAIARLSKLTASAPLDAWKDLLVFHTLDRHASLLPKKFADLSFDFHSHTLQGVPQQRERSKRAVAATSSELGFAVGQLYVEKHFPPAAKQQVEQLVKNLIAAFNERLDTLAWMAPATREKARAKLKTLRVEVGYPDHWPSYKGLVITADDPLTNALNVSKFNYEQRLAVLGKPVDRDHWWMTPQLVNAINLPLENELQFPAGILQPPFFDADADPAANYGSIGAVIGHEISHSFDNLGSQFDAEGRMHDWWTPADAAHFKEATQQLAKQFDGYEALPGLHVNGEQTLGEDIADISGLTIAYLAYHKSLDGKPAPVIDGLTGDQRFFLAFGQTWRSKMRDAALRQQVKTNVHAPAQFRAETVRNLDAWYHAFDVQPDARLYLKPDQRVKIW